MDAASSTPTVDHWKNQVLNTLQSLYNTTPPDCSVLVGGEHIPVHKTALQLNSTLLNSGDASYNKETCLTEIELLPEFSEQFELVSHIVGSFYTGSINVSYQNMKMIYKFAKCYKVPWLMDYSRPMFVDYITNDEGCERFVDVFKFAHSVWCSNLFEACIEVLDEALLEKILKSDALQQLNYFCIKTITASEKLCVTEKNVFQLVTTWCKENTSQNLGSLLENIQYCLIDNTYLSEMVFDFVLDNPNLEDLTRRLLLKGINSAMNEPIKRYSRSICGSGSQYKPPTPSHNYSQENDECLQKISIIMSGQKTEEDITISNDEMDLVFTEKFKHMDDEMREVVIDYLGSNKRIDMSNVTACLQLYDVYRSPRILRLFLDYFTRDHKLYFRLYDVQWHQISFDTVSAIVTNIGILYYLRRYDKSYYSRFTQCFQIELIMLWAVANPHEKDSIKELLKTICFQKIPSKYLELILLPCVQKLIPEIAELKCELQCDHDNMKPVKEMTFINAPNDVYMLCDITKTFRRNNVFYNMTFSKSRNCLSFASSGVCGHAVNNDDWCNMKFILFDAVNPCYSKYPIFTVKLESPVIKSFVKDANCLGLMYCERT